MTSTWAYNWNLLGGKLVAPPAPVQAIWDGTAVKRTPAAWGLHWVWNQPEVSVVLSGMSTLAQVEENVALATASGIGVLTEEELALYDRVRAKYQELIAIPCTRCGYCMPCPQGVDIPGNFATYNDGLTRTSRNQTGAHPANSCPMSKNSIG